MTRQTLASAAGRTTIFVDAAALADRRIVEIELEKSAFAEGRIIAAGPEGACRPIVLALITAPSDEESWEDAVDFAEFMLAQHAN